MLLSRGEMTPRTQKVIFVLDRCGSVTSQRWTTGWSGSWIGNWNGVSDSDGLSADDNFLNEQPKDLLPFDDIQSLGSATESAPKLG